MALKIPNEDVALFNGEKSELSSATLDAVVAAARRSGVSHAVTNECNLSFVSGRTFRIATGDVRHHGARYAVAQTDPVLAAGDATNPRWDMIVYDTGASAVEVKQGTPAAQAVIPDIDADQVALWAIWVPAGTASFPSGGAAAALDHAVDHRMLLSEAMALLAGRNGGQELVGGLATGETLTLRGNALDDGILELRVPTPTEGGAGDPEDESIQIVSAAGRKLAAFRFLDQTGFSGDTSSGLWFWPPVDGGRVRLDGFMSPGGKPLFQIHSHGMRETTHALDAPRQHFSAYTYVDTWTERTTITEAIGARTPGDIVSFDVASTAGLAVDDEFLIFAASKTPGVDAPDGSWEYLLITAINGLELTCESGSSAHPSPAHASGEKVWKVTHDSADKKWLEFGFGPCSDARTAGNVRLAFAHADVDLMRNKLLLNGAGGTMGGGTAWMEWDEGARRWTLTGVGGDGAALRLSRDTGTDDILQGFVAGQANPYFIANAFGGLSWGPGSGAVDLGLSRGDVGRLDLSATNRLTLSGTGALSVGTTNAPPQAYENVFLTPRTGQTHAALRIAGVGASAFADGGLYFSTARGTLASPTASVSGDRMGVIEFYAHDGDEYHRPSAIQAVVDGAVSNNVVPSRLEFHTSPTVVGSRVERMRVTSAGLVRIGPSTVTPAARAHVHEATLGAEVQRLESLATNDDPRESVFQGRGTTTDGAIPTALITITIPASTTVLIEAYVTARRTGGASGTAEDGAGYVLRAVVKNVAGTATLIGSASETTVGESQAGFSAAIVVAAGTAVVQSLGTASNNITWHATARVWPVGS